MTEGKPRILCIDDDREMGSLIAEELVERGFDVELAYEGQQGLVTILRSHPDLVLCDIKMPALSGFDILEKLAAMGPRFEAMPFIFVTALADRDTELKGRRLGADDYVTKPVDFDMLVTIIQARLARVARTAVWAKAVALTKREAEALAWAARGKKSSEIAIILELSKRTVDYYIESARRKLGVATRIEAAVKAASGRLIDP
jgi:DNA-binding response OmpR family regulator